MEQLCMQINDRFLDLYQVIYEHEKSKLLKGEFSDISFNDVHIIHCVGIEEPRNMSSIAKSLAVTVGSLTTAMNGLVKKGYAYRERSMEDRRVIYIRLTPKGEKVYQAHQDFHARVTAAIAAGFDRETLEMTLRVLNEAIEKAEAFER